MVDNNTSLSISGAFTQKESSAGIGGGDFSW
ncbi:hypothetical protein HCY02_13180 [Acinetobacter radioresistens]|nr:hypothetical protein [Acinetobacter radioresistens]